MAGTGEAGKRGPEVRSDCWIEVEIRTSGGLEIDMQSKVGGMFGDRITTLLTEGCGALGVEHARIVLEDQGALPFTLGARLETAVRRAGVDPAGEFLLPLSDKCTYGSDRGRLRRSRLYLPGNEPKFYVNAGLHEPDGVILDLEDSVAPAEKDAARTLVRNALRAVDFYGAERMVRINQGEAGLEDLEWVVPHNVNLVLIPKVEDPQQVVAVDRCIAAIKRKHGLVAPVFLMPIIESALGAWRAYEIGAACTDVVGLAIGLEDYTADIGAQRTLEGTESFWARAQVLNGARAAGVQPIDTVFSDVTDMEGLAASVREAKSLGFVGKGCIHPRQIAVVHDAFAPDEAEIDKATKIVRAFEEAEVRGLGVVSLGSKMIDAPVVKRALTTVTTAIQVGRLDPDWREDESAMNQRIDQAVAMFNEGYSCAQSLLGVYGPLCGLDRESALRLAAPFAGGISRTDGPCGAATGAILVLGLKYGHSHPDDEAGADRIRGLTREFLRRYRERKGSTLCTDILGANLSVPADLERVEAEELYDASCPDAVRTAAQLLEEMLTEPQDSQR